jgi:Fe-S oxidoreductase
MVEERRLAEMKDLIKDMKVSLCYSCGRCTLACPISSYNDFSPRRFVERIISKNELDESKVWECLTCGRCSVTCPSSVNFSGFIRSLRADMQSEADGKCAHAGILHSLMRLMANGDFKQNRLDWVLPDLEVAKEGDTMLFVGCAPYYDSYFSQWSPIEITRSAVKLLNIIGIKPVVLEDEVCCGHDLLWSGDEDGFQKLAEKNQKLIKDSKVKRIVFTCPECCTTFKDDYKIGGGVKLMHLTELLLENMDKIKFKENNDKISVHDSCRMGRYMGLYDAPRKILESIPGLEIEELPNSRERSKCCGTSCWMNCNWISKASQIATLQDAKEASGKLLTVCPKCKIHFSCAMDEKEKNRIVDVEDVIVTIAKSTDPDSTPMEE